MGEHGAINFTNNPITGSTQTLDKSNLLRQSQDYGLDDSPSQELLSRADMINFKPMSLANLGADDIKNKQMIAENKQIERLKGSDALNNLIAAQSNPSINLDEQYNKLISKYQSNNQQSQYQIPRKSSLRTKLA